MWWKFNQYSASTDFDHDGVPDTTDNCVAISNPDQADVNQDGIGDACDIHTLGTGGSGAIDVSTGGFSSMSVNTGGALSGSGGESTGGALSTGGSNNTAGTSGSITANDKDGDGIVDTSDNCPLTSNHDQTDVDDDGIGDACDPKNDRICPTSVPQSQCNGGWVLCDPLAIAQVPKGTILKGSGPAIYWYSKLDGKRYVFPNQTVFNSWYTINEDCPTVYQISDADLVTVPIGGNMTIRPGSQMIKITTDPKVYAITCGGVIHWIQTEAVMQQLYGSSWSLYVIDVPDAFFVDYKVGVSIASASDYNLDQQFKDVVTPDDNIYCTLHS